MSKTLAKGANYVIKGTKETAAITTKMGDMAVTVVHHATGPGRVAVKVGKGVTKAVTSMVLGK